MPGGGGATLSDATPAALGTAAAGVSTAASRADHVHEAPTGGGSATLGHSWERPAPATVPAGPVAINTDDLTEQAPTGLAVSAGVVATGWMQRLPSGFGDGRAALAGNPPRAYAESIDLSAYTIGAVSLAALWTWDGTQPSSYGISEVITFGDRNDENRGIHVAYVPNGGNTNLVAYSHGVATVLVASANLLAGAVGLHALAIAPVDASGHKWRFSYDGAAVADVAMGASYAPPSSSDAIGVGSRPDGLIYLNGRFVELSVWGSLLSDANLLALATLPGTPTYELPESASTGAAAIRVQACRYDPAYALPLLARGVSKPFTVAISTSKVNL